MSRRLLAFFVELFALLTYWKTAGSRKSIVWRDLTPRSAPSIVVVVLRPFVLRMPWVRAHGCEIPLAAIGCQARHLCEGAVHTVILHVVPGRRAGSKASDYLGIEGDADRDRRLQTTSGSSRQRREIREAGHRGAGLLETRDDTALQDGEILR